MKFNKQGVAKVYSTTSTNFMSNVLGFVGIATGLMIGAEILARTQRELVRRE